MPDLAMPVFNREPITSLVGIMHFPTDFKKAGVLASWQLAGALQAAPNEQVAAIGSDRIWAVHGARVSRDREGSKEGELSGGAGRKSRELPLARPENWNSATLEDAIRAAEITGKLKFPGVRSTFMTARKDFSKVLHFWAVLSSEYGNQAPRDWRLFISQAEAFLMEMRRLETTGTAFRSPKFHVSISDFDWPVLGNLRFGTLPEFLLPQSKKCAGRRPRIPVL
jgi:hypothetical protein